MGKIPRSLAEKMKDAVKGRNGLVVSDGGIFCNLCSVRIIVKDNTVITRVKEHCNAEYHKKRIGKELNVQPLITQTLGAKEKEIGDRAAFHRRLTRAFLSANIPLEKVSNPVFRSFLEAEMKRPIPASTTLRLHVKPVADELLANIVAANGDNDVYMIIDETQDPKSRNCVNVMVGILNGSPPKSMLLDVMFPECNNHLTAEEAVMNACTGQEAIWFGPNTLVGVMATRACAFHYDSGSFADVNMWYRSDENAREKLNVMMLSSGLHPNSLKKFHRIIQAEFEHDHMAKALKIVKFSVFLYTGTKSVRDCLANRIVYPDYEMGSVHWPHYNRLLVLTGYVLLFSLLVLSSEMMPNMYRRLTPKKRETLTLIRSSVL